MSKLDWFAGNFQELLESSARDVLRGAGLFSNPSSYFSTQDVLGLQVAG